MNGKVIFDGLLVMVRDGMPTADDMVLDHPIYWDKREADFPLTGRCHHLLAGMNREERLLIMSEIVGRPFDSTKDLTVAELVSLEAVLAVIYPQKPSRLFQANADG